MVQPRLNKKTLTSYSIIVTAAVRTYNNTKLLVDRNTLVFSPFLLKSRCRMGYNVVCVLHFLRWDFSI